MTQSERSDAAIEVRGLRKSYGEIDALRGVDLTVATGEVFALLGPNGAGKTTTVEILEGHRSPSAGDLRVLGHDPAKHERAYLERVGMVYQQVGVERFLTVAEVIEEFRGLYPDPLQLDDVLTAVGLSDQRDQLVRRLSGGQQRRLDVGVALAGNPELLFLDEPTTGFDPAARRGAWEVIQGLASRGTTVFLTTHYMEEAEFLADRVAVIANGRIVAEGTPASLRASIGRQYRISLGVTERALPRALAARFEVRGEDLVAEVDDPVDLLHDLTAWAVENGAAIEQLQVVRPTLEDVYLSLVEEPGE